MDNGSTSEAHHFGLNISQQAVKLRKERGSICQAEEGRDQKMAESLLRFIFLIAVFAIICSVSAVDDKCAACNAVAEELEHGLSSEKPRNHLDMRHRLDSKGQRKGKVIDYRVSELRVVDLLDGLCEKMQDYTLEKMDTNTHVWVRVDNWDDLTSNKQEARAHSKEISSYCGRLLEETEDELAELIKRGSVKAGDVSKILCQDISKHCGQTSYHQADSNDDDDIDAEL